MPSPLAGRPFTYRPQGLWDALDGEQAPPGVAFNLQNLMHDITTKGIWQPRPSVTTLTTFSSFSTPSVISAMLNVGTRVYGLVATAQNMGFDEPFCFDTATLGFVAVSGVTSSNVPATQATTGPWTPPTMDTVGGRILVTHPGFSGSKKFGWFDISGFSSATITGDTNSNTTINNLSSNVIAAGWQVGMTIVTTNVTGSIITAIAAGGLSITISPAATGSTGTQACTVTGGTSAAPVWGAGDMQGNALPSVPVFVKQFNNRAWFACNNQLRFSDSLMPTNATAATQFLTCGDTGSNITAIGALAVEQTQGGILAAIMAFKAAYGYWQVTGDSSTNNLTLNGPIGGVGCSAPRGVLQTPDGLSFIAEDGLRNIDFGGQISPAPKEGVRSPFALAGTPSRICGAYNNTVLRFSMQTVPNPLLPTVTAYCDYWYDYEISAWGGPHTFSYDCAVPMGVGFVLASNRLPGVLFMSAVEPAASDAFVEQGQQMLFVNQSSLFPQDESMLMKQITQSTVNVQFGSLTTPLTAMIVSSTMGIAGTATLTPAVRTIWGQFLWGQANWNGAAYGLNSYNIDWTGPVVYKEAAFLLTGACAMGLKIGPARFRTVELGYTNDQVPA